jgi:hypothetical protein
MQATAIHTHAVARIAAWTLLLCASDAMALATERSPAQPDATVVAGDFPRPALEVTTSNTPRFDSVETSLMPQQQRSGVGLSFGVTNFAAPRVGFTPPGTLGRTLDLGVHWRYTLDSSTRFDVTAYRRMPDNNDAISLIESHDPSYGARVEMSLGSDKLRKGFVAEKAFIGIQLEGGARLTVKRSFGGPMLYYRNSF